MTLNYEEITDDFGSKVLKATDEIGKEFWIPMVQGNADYEAYLNPKAALSTPMVLDESQAI